MILNLILKLNLKMISDLKIDFESDFESENVSRETQMPKAKLNHKKPIYGQKIVLPRFSFVKNFF